MHIYRLFKCLRLTQNDSVCWSLDPRGSQEKPWTLNDCQNHFRKTGCYQATTVLPTPAKENRRLPSGLRNVPVRASTSTPPARNPTLAVISRRAERWQVFTPLLSWTDKAGCKKKRLNFLEPFYFSTLPMKRFFWRTPKKKIKKFPFRSKQTVAGVVLRPCRRSAVQGRPKGELKAIECRGLTVYS